MKRMQRSLDQHEDHARDGQDHPSTSGRIAWAFGDSGVTGASPASAAAAAATASATASAAGRAEEPAEHVAGILWRWPRRRCSFPRALEAPFEVYVNGVRQREGSDFVRRGDELVFSRSLAHEGRLGFWRWTSLFLGVAGTYRKHDSVDVVYEVDGRRIVRTGLPYRCRTSR